MKKEERNYPNPITKQIIIIIPENIFHGNKESSRPTFFKHIYKNYFLIKKRIKKFSKPHNKTNNNYYPRKHFPRKQTTNKESSRPTFFKHIQKIYFLKKKLSNILMKPIIFLYQKNVSTKTNNGQRIIKINVFQTRLEKLFPLKKQQFSNPHNNRINNFIIPDNIFQEDPTKNHQDQHFPNTSSKIIS